MTNLEGKIYSFIDLKCWQKGHQLVLSLYSVTKAFPREELFSLTSQIRRAGISITSNIAEGFSRSTYKDKSRFYYTALGSLTEVQNQLLIAKDVKYIPIKDYEALIDLTIEVSKTLNGLIKKSNTIHIHDS